MNKITIGQINIHRYNLYDEIENFSDYAEFIEDMAKFTKSDSIALYINSPGGRVDIGLSLINTIKSTEAKVTAVVEGPSYSMASILALACDNLIMYDNTFLMFHNYSSMAYGKGGELMSSLRHSDDHFNKLMVDTCSPFLTKPELKKIQRDEDLYIYSNDNTLEKRKNRHFNVEK